MPTTSFILAMAVIALAIVIISAGVKVVPQSETRVVERLGRFHSVLSPGLNFIIPFIDRPKTIYTRRIETAPNGRPIVRMTSTNVIDLREQVYDFPSQQVITRDNVTTEINALLYFQITDPKKPSMRSTTSPTPSRNSRRHPCATSSANSSLTKPSPRATPSTPSCR